MKCGRDRRCRSASRTKGNGAKETGNGIGSSGWSVAARVAVGATRVRCDLHGDDREHAVRLDPVRQPDRREVPLGTRGHSGRVHDLRRHGNLARADRRLSRRQVRPAAGGRRGRLAMCCGVGDQFDGVVAADAVFRGGGRRRRRGRGVRHLRRQRAQVVPDASRARRRHHRGGLRRGIGRDGRTDRAHDQEQRLRADLPLVRAGARDHRVPARHGAVRAARQHARAGEECAQARRLQRESEAGAHARRSSGSCT